MLSQTSKVIVGIIVDQLEKGDIKGLEEYGVSIDDADDIIYNWQLEAMAEMADGLKYQQKEIVKLKAENIRLKAQPRFKLEEENLRLVEENESLKGNADYWHAILVEECEKVDKLIKENERFKKDVVDLKEENERLKRDIKTMEYTINRYNHDLTECEKENVKLKKTVKAWEIAVNDMTNRLKGGK
jgi:chromosome segregation ATPase